MVDFTIRETRGIMESKFVMIRLGTCGTPSGDVNPGDICVQSNSVFIHRNPDGFRKNSTQSPYLISQKVDANKSVVSLLKQSLSEVVGKDHVFEGLGATSDSFYSSQGRVTGTFVDKNEQLIDGQLLKEHPDCVAIEMETFHLFDMAECSEGHMIAASACLVLAQRKRQIFIENDLKDQRELEMGRAGLEAIIKVEL